VVADDNEELLLESVVYVRPDNGTVYLKNLFGEEKTFEGRIKEVLLNKNKVILAK
ncbi:CooT family nickel-binding protein, partial [Nitrospirota bacterium]